MKKVCHILNSLLPSGAETMLVNSAHLWGGYEKHVVATKKELGGYSVEFEKAGYIVHHVYKEGFFAQHKAMRVFLKDLSPDVVHIHCENQDCYYALDAKMARVKRVVRTVHNVFEFHGVLRVRRIITRAFGRLLGAKYIAIGKSVYDNEKNRFKNTPVTIIDNWCDESKYRYIEPQEKVAERVQMQIEDDTFVLVSVGNCSAVKNHQYVLHAIKTLREKYGDALQLKYYHVGSGTDEAQEKEYVEKHDLSKHVVFVGRADPMPYYSIADLNVMPSLYEGVSISAIEAMSCGIPCLFTDVVGLCDFKQLKSEDVCYAMLNQENYAEALVRLYEMFQSGTSAVSSAQMSLLASEKYSREKSVEKYIKIYDS